QPLRLRSLLGEHLPPISRVQLTEAVIRELCTGNRDLAGQGAEPCALCGVIRRFQLTSDLCVNRRVDPADEETGYAGDPAEIAAVGCTRARTFYVSFCRPFVHFRRKK